MFAVIVSYELLDEEMAERHFPSVDEVKKWAMEVGEDKFYSLFVEDEYGEVFIEDFESLVNFV